RWEAAALPDFEALFASWPLTVELNIPPLGTVLFCHATPRNDTEVFTKLTSDERLAPVFAGVRASVVVCGHSHMQFDRRVGSIRVVNAGSIGMPFGAPRADWLLLGPTVELRHTSYDLARAAERIRRATYPQAEEYARGVLQPRSEREMLERFGKFELKDAKDPQIASGS